MHVSNPHIMNDYPTSSPISEASTPPMSPYQTPNTVVQTQAQNSDNAVSIMIIGILVRTRKWVRLCSVLGFIGSAFMVLAGLFMMISGGTLGASSGMGGAAYGGGVMLGMGLLYLVFAILYIYPSLRLWQYASSISRLESSSASFDLETALDKQRSFWKFVGIMVCIILGLYAVGIVFFIIGATALQMQ